MTKQEMIDDYIFVAGSGEETLQSNIPILKKNMPMMNSRYSKKNDQTRND